MDKKLKILSFVDDLSDSYREPVEINSGLLFNHKDTIRTIDFYTNNEYTSGKRDALGREKPFYNVSNFRITVAKTATDLDVKDIKFEPESLNDSVQTMLINHELFKYLKEINFSETLNDMGKTRPKYGGVLIKKYDDGEGTEIEVVDWKNVDVDPCDIADGVIIETHYLQPDELSSRSDVWENIDEVLTAHNKANKNKPKKVEIKEVSGVFNESFVPEKENPSESKFQRLCFYIAVVGKKKWLLHWETEKKSKYKYLAWEKVPGRDLGRGVVEEGFEAQVWINDIVIAWKNAMDLSGKVFIATDSQKLGKKGNAFVGAETGQIFEVEPGRNVQSLSLLPSSFPQFSEVINLWNTQYDKVSSVYDANTGEAPTAGTPYSQTALLNQVANSPFEYQREVWGIFLNEVLNDWILPEVKKRILKPHYLVSEFSDEELEIIDEAIKNKNKNKFIKEDLLKGKIPSPEAMMGMDNAIAKSLRSLKTKREIEIPEGFLDVEGKITANITGELKNKSVMLQSVDTILRNITQSFNPNTGEYMILKDPVLSQLFGKIVEMVGIPFATLKGASSFSQPTTTAPSTPDLSAIAPASPVPPSSQLA